MRILIGYDGSESANAALNDLRSAGLPRAVEVLILSVVEVMAPASSTGAKMVSPPLSPRRVAVALAQVELQAAHTAEVPQEQKELAAKAGECLQSYFPDWQVQTEAVAGSPSTELINKADAWKADLVVVGSQGRSALGRFILGSVSKKVVTDSQHSVRVARGAIEKNDRESPRVMIGVDGSSEAEHAVRAVGIRVWPERTEVRIVAIDDGTSPARISRILPSAATMIRSSNEKALDASRMMVEWAERELGAVGLQVSVAIEKGDPQRALIKEAVNWNVDSIFVGSRKFDGTFERFSLGSVSTAVVTKAHCSVEVVRSMAS